MKLDDVVEVNLVDRSPKETYRPVREMAAKIIVLCPVKYTVQI